MSNGLLRNTTEEGVVRLDWLDKETERNRRNEEYGQRSAAQHDRGGSRATRLAGQSKAIGVDTSCKANQSMKYSTCYFEASISADRHGSPEPQHCKYTGGVCLVFKLVAQVKVHVPNVKVHSPNVSGIK